eukprot:scaffold203256_cov32-Prasinocladus_malaysianus.AAC.1
MLNFNIPTLIDIIKLYQLQGLAGWPAVQPSHRTATRTAQSQPQASSTQQNLSFARCAVEPRGSRG